MIFETKAKKSFTRDLLFQALDRDNSRYFLDYNGVYYKPLISLPPFLLEAVGIVLAGSTLLALVGVPFWISFAALAILVLFVTGLVSAESRDPEEIFKSWSFAWGRYRRVSELEVSVPFELEPTYNDSYTRPVAVQWVDNAFDILNTPGFTLERTQSVRDRNSANFKTALYEARRQQAEEEKENAAVVESMLPDVDNYPRF